VVLELLHPWQALIRRRQRHHTLDDCKAQFRAAWARIRVGLTEANIARAQEYAEASREALARYDRKGGK
jgi:hypothetical protein